MEVTMARNYNVVLGVAPAASERGIRLAYRDLVKRHRAPVYSRLEWARRTVSATVQAT
jgi:hypothetical protein